MNSGFLKSLSVFKKRMGGFLIATLITAIVGGIGHRIISSNMATLGEPVSEDIRFMANAGALPKLSESLKQMVEQFNI
jgi:glycine cleavage system regulatory protein